MNIPALQARLSSALSLSRSAEGSLSTISQGASSLSSTCMAQGSEALGAAWDSRDKDVSSIGSGIAGTLSGLDSLEQQLNQAAAALSAPGASPEDSMRQLQSELAGSSDLPDELKRTVQFDLTEALVESGNAGFHGATIGSDLASGQRNLGDAGSSASQVAGDGPQKDVSDSGRSLQSALDLAHDNYSGAASSASQALGYQQSVTGYLRQALQAAGGGESLMPAPTVSAYPGLDAPPPEYPSDNSNIDWGNGTADPLPGFQPLPWLVALGR